MLAVIAGVALTTPLGNLGSGVLLAFTQPVRLGDRITVDDQTGVVDEITLSYTALATDEGDASSCRTDDGLDDAREPLGRRSATDRHGHVPIRMGTSLADARRITIEAASEVPQGDLDLAIYVQVSEMTEKTAWLTSSPTRRPAPTSHPIASEIRERTVAALAAADLLPGLELCALAGAEHPHLDLGTSSSWPRRIRPAGGRGTRGAGETEVDRGVRAPVDRDPRPGPISRGLRCALRIEVATARVLAPTPRSERARRRLTRAPTLSRRGRCRRRSRRSASPG